MIKHFVNIGFRFLGFRLWFFLINKFVRELFIESFADFSFLCFVFALISVVFHCLVCLLSFNSLTFLNDLSSIHLVPNSDVTHNGNGHSSLRVLFRDRILRTIGSPLLSLLFLLDYTRSCFYRNIFFSLHCGIYYKSQNRQTLQYLLLHYTIYISFFHLITLTMSSL